METKINEESYIKEKSLEKYPQSISVENLKIIIEQSEKSICKIICDKGGFGTGFFCLIPFPDKCNLLKVLITNNHVINKDFFYSQKIIKFTVNNDKFHFQIKIDNSRKFYTNEIYDITFIELKDSDGIDIYSFLELDDKVFVGEPSKLYKEKSIYLIH